MHQPQFFYLWTLEPMLNMLKLYDFPPGSAWPTAKKCVLQPGAQRAPGWSNPQVQLLVCLFGLVFSAWSHLKGNLLVTGWHFKKESLYFYKTFPKNFRIWLLLAQIIFFIKNKMVGLYIIAFLFCHMLVSGKKKIK